MVLNVTVLLSEWASGLYQGSRGYHRHCLAIDTV